MASAAVHQQGGHATSFEPIDASEQVRPKQEEKLNVRTSLNYYLDDGNPPAPTYVGKPETYVRPAHALEVTVRDIRGEEANFTLDKNGFQVYPHVSKEKDFLNDEKIKAEYYPETEKLIKDA